MEFKAFIVSVFVLHLSGCVSGIKYFYMDENCGTSIDISSIHQVRIKTTRYGDYSKNMACFMTLKAEYGSKMMVFFKDLDTENNCKYDYLKLLDGNSSSSAPIGYKTKYCGTSYPSTVLTTRGQFLYLLFHSDSSRQGFGFDIVVTEYHRGFCHTWEHRCPSGRCIDNTVKCAGYNPCGDQSDCDVSTGTIVAAIFGPLLVIISIVAVIVTLRRLRARLFQNSTSTSTVATTTASGNMTTATSFPAYTQHNSSLAYGQSQTSSSDYDSPPSYESLRYGYNNPVPSQNPQYPGTSTTPQTQPYPCNEMKNPTAAF